jgi:hypothetical protein
MPTQDNTYYLGIHPSTGKSPLTFCILNRWRKLVEKGSVEADVLIRKIDPQNSYLVCINGPGRLNNGRMNNADVRVSLGLNPTSKQWTNLRQAEYELAKEGIKTSRTPDKLEDCSQSVKLSVNLIQQLDQIGFEAYPNDDAPKRWMESPAKISFQNLLRMKPFSEKSILGRIQRQLLLCESQLPIQDPMVFFEEVTRYRMLQGNLPMDHIESDVAINAMLMAYIAWMADNRQRQIQIHGESKEGFIVLPIA